MLNINLKQLEAFVAVVEANNFTRAAEQLFLAQPTVSAHIRSLEQELGTPLFLRGNKRTVALTPEAQRVYRYAKDILLLCQELEGSLAEEAQRISLGASTVPANYIVPQLMQAFSSQSPTSSYQLRLGNSEHIHRLLTRGEIALGFVGGMEENRSFTYQTLREDTLVLVTKNSQFYQNKQAEGLLGSQLLTQPMICRNEGSATQEAIHDYLKEENIPLSSLNIIAKMDAVQSIKQSVIQGLGVAILSELTVADGVESGQLLQFPLPGQGAKRLLYLVTVQGKKLSLGEKAFLKFVQAQLQLVPSREGESS